VQKKADNNLYIFSRFLSTKDLPDQKGCDKAFKNPKMGWFSKDRGNKIRMILFLSLTLGYFLVSIKQI